MPVPAPKNQRNKTMQEVQPTRTLMGRLNHGADLLEEIHRICHKESITLGTISGLGAVQRACLGYYDQTTHRYRFIDFPQHLEITHLVGNISLKDGVPFAHIHMTVTDAEGKAFGGHVAPNTRIFACEVVIQVFDGPSFKRQPDPQTGLPLW
jgi:hypothetical protein